MNAADKLVESLLENTSDDHAWYDRLWQLFQASCQRGDFKSLSNILGHDPDDEDDDCLGPEELKHDQGWAWDQVRAYFKAGHHEDTHGMLDVAEWLGVNVAGISPQLDWEQALQALKERVLAA